MPQLGQPPHHSSWPARGEVMGMLRVADVDHRHERLGGVVENLLQHLEVEPEALFHGGSPQVGVQSEEDDLAAHLLGNVGHAGLFAVAQVAAVPVLVELAADGECAGRSPELVGPGAGAGTHGLQAEVGAHEEVRAKLRVEKGGPAVLGARGMSRGASVAGAADVDAMEGDARVALVAAGAAEVPALIVDVLLVLAELVGPAEGACAEGAAVDASVEMCGMHVSPEDIFALVGAGAERAGPGPVYAMLGAGVADEGVLAGEGLVALEAGMSEGGWGHSLYL